MAKETNLEGHHPKAKIETVYLGFFVKDMGDNLFSAGMVLIGDDMVIEKRTGLATSLGHAIGAAEDLLGGWAIQSIERKPEDFFRNVML